MYATASPLISIIVPIYNTEKYLKECIDSIIAQTYENLEIILVDDGSPDNCPEICDSYCKKDGRITVIHKTNSGVSDARNQGLNAAKGEYVVFVDSDDYVKPDYIETLFKHANADVVVSASSVCGYFKVEEVIKNLEEIGGFVAPYHKLYKKEAIESVSFPSGIRIGEDILFNIDVLCAIKDVVYIDYSGYIIRENPASVTRGFLGKYTPMLDFEYQQWWHETLEKARNKLGLTHHDFNYENKISVKVFQMIQNWCYKDAPYSFTEKLKNIKKVLCLSKKTVLSAQNPVSPNTQRIIKLCLRLHFPIFTYLIFKSLKFLK